MAGWLAFASGVVTVKAVLTDLDAFVTYAIMQQDGVTPLADGSWVYVYVSVDAIADPMVTVGSPATNYIAGSWTTNDYVIGAVQIGNAGSNGTFFTTLQYDSSVYNYAYIRFFNFTNPLPVTGMVWWGESDVLALGITAGVATVQFDFTRTLTTDQHNNFVVIPEPSTANLVILIAGMFWAMRASMRKRDDGDGKKSSSGGTKT